MIESIEFVNFKALRSATLPLAPFTLLLGPNGSGKSSVLQAIQAIAQSQVRGGGTITGAQVWQPSPSSASIHTPVSITLRLRLPRLVHGNTTWHDVSGHITYEWQPDTQTLSVKPALQGRGATLAFQAIKPLFELLSGMQTFSLDPTAIAMPVPVNAGSLRSDGSGLAAVLDDIKDNHPERWELLLEELRVWLPEYDHIQFVKPKEGFKAVALRTKKGGHRIPASELSQGTLVAMALLTLAYLPNPPSLIGLEEIDHGLHPRLLRHLQDALYRLCYPEAHGETRPPIQVIATTHSPYLLDLYREHPEEVVLAQKEGLEVQFKQLSKIDHFDEILGDSPLSEVWYSGVLGGVSVKP